VFAVYLGVLSCIVLVVARWVCDVEHKLRSSTSSGRAMETNGSVYVRPTAITRKLPSIGSRFLSHRARVAVAGLLAWAMWRGLHGRALDSATARSAVNSSPVNPR